MVHQEGEIYYWRTWQSINNSPYYSMAPVKIILITNDGDQISFETLTGEKYTMSAYNFDRTAHFIKSEMTPFIWEQMATIMKSYIPGTQCNG